MAHFECRINKNALFQTVFLAILPTEKAQILICSITQMTAKTHFFNIMQQKPLQNKFLKSNFFLIIKKWKQST